MRPGARWKISRSIGFSGSLGREENGQRLPVVDLAGAGRLAAAGGRGVVAGAAEAAGAGAAFLPCGFAVRGASASARGLVERLLAVLGEAAGDNAAAGSVSVVTGEDELDGLGERPNNIDANQLAAPTAQIPSSLKWCGTVLNQLRGDRPNSASLL